MAFGQVRIDKPVSKGKHDYRSKYINFDEPRYPTFSSVLNLNCVLLVFTLVNSVSKKVQLLKVTWLMNILLKVQFTKRQFV